MAITSQSYKAIISGWSWAGYDTYNAPMVVTYSFPTAKPSWHNGMYGDDKFTAMSATQQKVMEKALDAWEAVCGIRFVEAKGDHGDITFSNYDFSTMGNGSSAQAFGYYPYNSDYEVKGPGGDRLDISGDIFFRDDLPASRLVTVAMHEIGHAIGLKHPWETETGHTETLAYEDDHRGNTVMSYDGEHLPKLGKLDLIAAKKLYGDASTNGTGADKMSWSSKTETLKQWGDDDNESIRGVNLKDIVSAGAGDDKIFTFGGDDIINGGLGKNTIWTGEDCDTIRIGRGAHTDKVMDFDTDFDVLQFVKIRGVDSVEDLRFTQKGDDLVIKWTDGANKGAVVLADVHENWLGDNNFLFV